MSDIYSQPPAQTAQESRQKGMPDYMYSYDVPDWQRLGQAATNPQLYEKQSQEITPIMDYLGSVLGRQATIQDLGMFADMMTNKLMEQRKGKMQYAGAGDFFTKNINRLFPKK